MTLQFHSKTSASSHLVVLVHLEAKLFCLLPELGTWATSLHVWSVLCTICPEFKTTPP